MGSIRLWFEWVDALPSSIAIRESLYGYPALLTTHVIAMALFAGLIAMMDLRLVGIAFKRTPVSQIQKQLFPWQMFGLVVSSVTGLLLFYGQPLRYYGKAFFWMKMSVMVFAGVNALIFHRTTYRSIVSWDTGSAIPTGSKVAGGISLVLWACVVLFGRLTAYNWLTYD